MDDLHRLEAKGLARAKIRSQRRRVSMIRRRTIRGSLALFAIFWAVIFGQLVTGNDPALSRIRKNGHGQLTATGGAKTSSARASVGTSAGTAPPEPQPESQLERELERERGLQLEPGERVESAPEGEFESPPKEEGAREEAEPAPSPPIVTSAS